MGEAKRRKAIDPSYGRLPKTTARRGLIVSPPIEIVGAELRVKSSNLDPQELRFSLLFWDRLVWPSSKAIYFASNQDEEYLESIGVLKRPDYTVFGSGDAVIGQGQIRAFQELDKKEPGVWSLAQGENSLLWKGGLVEERTGALVELHRAVPIPHKDVPLAEILEFRERRRDELSLLRHQLDTFVTEIEGAADKSESLQSRVTEVDNACANLLAVGREWQFPVYLANIKASFSLSPVKFLPAVAGGVENW